MLRSFALVAFVVSCSLSSAASFATEVNIGGGAIVVGPDGVKVGPIDVKRDKDRKRDKDKPIGAPMPRLPMPAIPPIPGVAGPNPPGTAPPSDGGQYAGQTLQHSDFSNAKLKGFDFSNAKLVSVDFSNADLSGANFSGATLMGVDMSNADLPGANLSGAVLQGVDLSNATLTKACLTKATLAGVDFSNADLSGAVLTASKNLGSDFKNAKTNGAVWKGSETCPGTKATQAPRPKLTKAVVIEKALAEGENARVDLTITFDTDSDRILGPARAQVLEIANALKSRQLKARRILIEGHTDAVGADDYNLDLSYRRAISVLRTLTESYGIPAARLKVKGFGETQPVATNDTSTGRALNRRVTLVNIGG